MIDAQNSDGVPIDGECVKGQYGYRCECISKFQSNGLCSSSSGDTKSLNNICKRIFKRLISNTSTQYVEGGKNGKLGGCEKDKKNYICQYQFRFYGFEPHFPSQLA